MSPLATQGRRARRSGTEPQERRNYRSALCGSGSRPTVFRALAKLLVMIGTWLAGRHEIDKGEKPVLFSLRVVMVPWSRVSTVEGIQIRTQRVTARLPGRASTAESIQVKVQRGIPQ